MHFNHISEDKKLLWNQGSILTACLFVDLSNVNILVPGSSVIFSICKLVNQKHIKSPGNAVEVKEKIIFFT